MQMARAYAAFANGGYGVMPRFIEKITDAQGKVLFEAPKLPDAPSEDARIIPARNAFVMASLLNEVARTGTGAKAQATLKRPDIYGKTGTTNDAVDTWFAGFQPKITTVVWMGRDDNTSLGAREFGATLALPIWIDFMKAALKDEPVVTLPAPSGVQEAQGDWLYDEFVGGGYISYLGMEPGNPPSVQVAGSPQRGRLGAGRHQHHDDAAVQPQRDPAAAGAAAAAGAVAADPAHPVAQARAVGAGAGAVPAPGAGLALTGAPAAAGGTMAPSKLTMSRGDRDGDSASCFLAERSVPARWRRRAMPRRPAMPALPANGMCPGPSA